MRALSLLVALSILACAACSSGTYVAVTVESGAPLSVTALDVTITNAGMKGHSTFNKGGQPFTLPQSLALKLDDTRSGDATVEVIATGPNGELARATMPTQIIPHGTATLTVTLLPSQSSDMSVQPDMGSVPDSMGSPDLGVSPKLLNFAAPRATSFGSNPQGLIAGNFDANQKLDLVVFVNNTIIVLLGNGDGSFVTGKTYAIAATPLLGADVNHDGFVDLICSGTNEIDVLLGKGDGTFDGPKITMPAPMSEGAFGDLNRDGLVDLVTIDYFNNNFSAWLGDGKGMFTGGVPKSTVFAPRSVSLADINQDGQLDLLIPDMNNSNVRASYGVGDGSFAGGVMIPSGGTPTTIATGDLNADGKVDLVLTSFGRKTMTTLINMGGGAFAMTDYALSGSPSDVHIGNFNGDAWPDLTTTDNKNNRVAVLVGKGSGAFASALTYQVSGSPTIEVTGDFNGDGLDDIATANGGSNDISVLLNTSQ